MAERFSMDLPKYIDPRVLEIGQSVRCLLDGEDEHLVVVRIEPAVVCARPDGDVVTLPAHTVEVIE